MQDLVNTGKMEQLKKTISTLEWDLNFIRDEDLKSKKEEELRAYRIELKRLLDKNSKKLN